MEYLSQNLKYILLGKGISRDDWVMSLASILQCGSDRSQALLNGDTTNLKNDESEILTKFSGITSVKLLSENLLKTDKIDIFSRNISFLINRLPHGKKKHLAESLGVDQTTISRWGNGTQQPAPKKIMAILDYFNLPGTIDLNNDPLFLSTIPIGEDETKKWLKDKIDDLDRERLKELVPALMILLKGK